MPDVELVDMSTPNIEKSQVDSSMDEAMEKPSFDPVHPKDMLVRFFWKHNNPYAPIKKRERHDDST